jgi:amino acid adenylation domain-containing protein
MRTAETHGENRDVVSLFQEQVKRAPAAIALVAGEARITYDELNRRANQLARHLRERGAARHARIGVCLERSVEMIVAQLAILKLGAMYVPLDPQYPIARLQLLFEDTAAPLTVTRERISAEVRREMACPVLLGPDTGAGHEDFDLGVAIDPTSGACVMFTSGTTGRPKGAEIPHSGISRLLRNAGYIELDAQDVILHHSTCAFDAATFEVWAALLNGGALVLYPPRQLDLASLSETVREHGVTTLLLTTAVFHLVAEHDPDCLGTLRQVVVGGDVMRARPVRRVLARHPHLTIINGYGPTENTVFTCCFVIKADTALGDTVPIGRPIHGTNVFVLDADMQPVPDGEIGELYTNGLGMARGYVNSPELTREKFVPCPFSEAGAILYRTGDLVRKGLDDNYYFVGRTDGQVKVRGFRVEPGEIETVLSGRPDIEEAVVLAHTSSDGDKYLVAYLKPAKSADGLNLPQIRAYLASQLPHYMVPAAWHEVAEFPLTPNGKIDRTGLQNSALHRHPPADGWPLAQPGAQTNANGNEVLQTVLNLWREALGTSSLPAEGSVYDYGASSLTVILVLSKLNSRYACAVSPDELAEATTPLEWARAYERVIGAAAV